jgi:hypothetical protein
MGLAIPATLFGGDLALLEAFGELAAPRLAITPKTSGETLVPMMDMFPARGDWHRTHLVSHSSSGFVSRVCNCEQRHTSFGGILGSS